MKKKNMYVLAMIVVLIAAWALPIYPAATGEKKILRFAYTMPSKKSYSYGWEWLGPEFEKRTNGRYRIEYYPSETLFKGGAAFDSVMSGVAQFSNISVGQFEKRLPLSSITLLPVLDFPTSIKGRIGASKTFLEMVQKFPQIQAEFKGLKLIGHHQLTPYILISKKKEIFLPEHFKGLKVGGTGSKMKIISNHGGAEVSQIPPDTYMNMDRGVVDAALVSWTQIWDYKLWEVAKYFYDTSFSSGSFLMVANEEAWNAMSPEDQKIFQELWDKASLMAVEKTFEEGARGPKATLENGGIIRKPMPAETPAWRKAAQPVIEEWVRIAKNQKAKDPEAILAEWQRQIDAFKE